MAPPQPSPEPLMNTRAVVICLLALIAAAVVGGLTYLARRNVAEAFLAASVATPAAVGFFQRHVGSP